MSELFSIKPRLSRIHWTRAPVMAMAAIFKACLPARGLDHYLKLLRRCRATLLDHLTNNTDVSGQDASLLRSVVWHCDVLESHWGELEQICDHFLPDDGLVIGQTFFG